VKAALLLLVLLAACGQVPEQALRDEQARARQYRDAYETTAAELAAAKARLAALDQRCAAK
jgi:ABC-type Fe3+-hydroxamate transport system substrate-binding protein